MLLKISHARRQREATGAFVKVLDRAWMQISTEAFDYNTTIRSAVKTLAEKGIQTANYTSGKTTSVEAAVRRAVLTGINQTSLKMQDALADEMDSDLVEVTAHSGAGRIMRSGRAESTAVPENQRSTRILESLPATEPVQVSAAGTAGIISFLFSKAVRVNIRKNS